MCKSYKARNREKIAEYNKTYKSDPVNKALIKEYNHTYNIENREAIQKRQNVQHLERQKVDHNYKMRTVLSKRLLHELKNYNLTKTNKTMDLLGTDMKSFMLWLEHLFYNDLSWENHGTVWHMDHIIPINYFDLTNNDHIKIAFNWKNTRSLSIKENLQKKNNIIFEDIKRHDNILKSFLSEIDNPQPSISEMS